jgi:hypothetical protein
MNPQREQFLNLKATPARLTVEEAAWCLGFSAHEIPILVARGLLTPLGHPPSNGPKYFATETLSELHKDVKWLARATDAIVQYWKSKNARKTGAGEQIANNQIPDDLRSVMRG